MNNRRTQVLLDEQLAKKFWREVQVGNIIKLNNNDFVPVRFSSFHFLDLNAMCFLKADLLLISSSEPNGICLIETADLDGYEFPI